MRNYINRLVLLLIFTLILLYIVKFAFQFFPAIELKEIDLLSDIRRDTTTQQTVATVDQPEEQNVIIPEKSHPKVKGKQSTAVEDYDSLGHSFRNLFLSLQQADKKPVRIAFYGDSFIEGDILVGDLRDTLQSIYGGHGVGYVPLASEVAQYRITILHTYSNWKTWSIVSKRNNAMLPGMPGYCFEPLADNQAEYRIARRSRTGFDEFHLFYSSPAPARVSYTLNDSTASDTTIMQTDGLGEWIAPLHQARSIKLNFDPSDSLLAYGASFEKSHGIYLDNFAMRGNSGISLSAIPDEKFTQFNALRDYKLIIMQYGLNVVGEADSTNYEWYANRMIDNIERIKKLVPNAGFLLISISDRSFNVNGEFKTRPSIPRMRDVQRRIAKRCGIAFWDLYTAMGGEGSMSKLAMANPPLAAKDFTHLNHRGGKIIAGKLARALLSELSAYE